MLCRDYANLNEQERANIRAFWFTTARYTEQIEQDNGVPTLEEYCWEPGHQQGWSCIDCWNKLTEQERALYTQEKTNMSIHMNIQELQAFYASIHRLAKEQVAEAQIHHIMDVLARFYSFNDAFKIYWQLQEKQPFFPAHEFIEQLRIAVKTEMPESVKEFWTGASAQ